MLLVALTGELYQRYRPDISPLRGIHASPVERLSAALRRADTKEKGRHAPALYVQTGNQANAASGNR
jgi:hypothetical protein